ncbi:MAG: hypothetical protein ACXWJK_15550 [Burkholderiaceae bacterium]
MTDNYVTRGELFLLLTKWQSGELSAQDVWDWASHRCLPGYTQYDDWEDDSSVANEILCHLDSLDMNLVLVEDAPIHLAFLSTAVGDFTEGYRQWRQAHEQIDFETRRQLLQDDPIYGPFCKRSTDGDKA